MQVELQLNQLKWCAYNFPTSHYIPQWNFSDPGLATGLPIRFHSASTGFQ